MYPLQFASLTGRKDIMKIENSLEQMNPSQFLQALRHCPKRLQQNFIYYHACSRVRILMMHGEKLFDLWVSTYSSNNFKYFRAIPRCSTRFVVYWWVSLRMARVDLKYFTHMDQLTESMMMEEISAEKEDSAMLLIICDVVSTLVSVPGASSILIRLNFLRVFIETFDATWAMPHSWGPRANWWTNYSLSTRNTSKRNSPGRSEISKYNEQSPE